MRITSMTSGISHHPNSSGSCFRAHNLRNPESSACPPAGRAAPWRVLTPARRLVCTQAACCECTGKAAADCDAAHAFSGVSQPPHSCPAPQDARCHFSRTPGCLRGLRTRTGAPDPGKFAYARLPVCAEPAARTADLSGRRRSCGSGLRRGGWTSPRGARLRGTGGQSGLLLVRRRSSTFIFKRQAADRRGAREGRGDHGAEVAALRTEDVGKVRYSLRPSRKGCERRL